MTVPKIRFKGFEGDWQKCNLGDVTSIRGGYAFQSSQFQKQGIPIVRISNLLQDGNVGGEYACYPKIDGDSNVTLHAGDVVIAMSGATTGKIARVKNHEGTLYQNQRVGLFVRTNKVDYNYLYSIVNSIRFSESLNKLLASSAQPNASSSDIESVEMCFPINREEQEYLGEYIRFFDSLIQCTAKKITSLKQTKQACLQSMFPQPGETTPRIRFKGFEGKWEKVQIGKLGDTYSGLTGKSKSDFGSGKAQYITFLNVLTNAHIDTTIFDSVDVKVGERQNAVLKGDILFNTSSETPEEVGLCSVLMEDVENLYLNSFCFGFRPYADAIHAEFLVYLMRSNIGRSIMKILAQGATRYNLSKKRLCEATITAPASREEQQQIAAFFSNMDKQIRIQEQRLEKLKQIKAACLENMFV